MKFFNDLTLKNKIFLTCLGFILLVSILIALFTRALLISSLTSELQKRGVGIAQGIADSARVFMLTENRAELTAIAYDARQGNRRDIVRYLIISDNRGRILAHTFTTGFPAGIDDAVRKKDPEILSITPMAVEDHLVFNVSVPVKEGIYTIGAVHMGLDKKHIEKLISDLRLIFLSFLSVITVIFFFLSHRLALHITQPVSALISYTDQITQGNFTIPPDVETIGIAAGSGENADEIVKLAASFINMTARLKESTDRLRESQQKYRSLFQSGPNPIFVVETDTFNILDANPNAIELFGYQREELIKMKLSDLGRLTDDPLIPAGTRGDTMVNIAKVKFFRKDGHAVFVNVHARLSKYREEDVIIVATTDISELVEKDSQLIQASKMANLEKMSAGIAHEINQPLNAIKMGSEYLCMMNERNQPVRKADLNMVLGQISTQVTRAAEIVGRLKSFSRKAEFSREVININACILSVNKIIGRQIALQNIELVVDLDHSLPMVLAHNNRMEQVIFNLVTNARDAIHEKLGSLAEGDAETGRIVIRTLTDNTGAIMEISDNGTGIAPEHMDIIFESFFTTKEMGEGLGLGLPIIEGIVKDYGGTIAVKSARGEGACFRVVFPAYQTGSQ